MGPLLPLKLIKELHDQSRLNKIYKCIAHVAFILKIDRQVQEVVRIRMILVDQILQQLDRVFVRNILYHHRGSSVHLNLHRNFIYSVHSHEEHVRVLIRNRLSLATMVVFVERVLFFIIVVLLLFVLIRAACEQREP